METAVLNLCELFGIQGKNILQKVNKLQTILSRRYMDLDKIEKEILKVRKRVIKNIYWNCNSYYGYPSPHTENVVEQSKNLLDLYLLSYPIPFDEIREGGFCSIKEHGGEKVFPFIFITLIYKRCLKDA